MTWKQALAMFSDADGFMETADPFYVPGRTAELVSFLGAASAAWFVPVAPLFLPLTSQNLAVIAVAALIASVMSFRGFQERKYRLRRTQTVAQLKARLLDSREA